MYGFGGGQSIPIFKFSFSHISLPEMITAYFGVCTVLGLGRAYQYKIFAFPTFFTRDDNRLLWCVYGFGGGQGIPILKFCFSHISLPEMITAYFGACTVLGVGRAYQYSNFAFLTFLYPR